MEKHLHIIALNIPYPPNYGGIIDIYYKLKALHERGIRIILHCFEYERPHSSELEQLCQQVYYYRRRTGWLSNLTLLPYNVYSRKNPALLDNLLRDDYPILFEGLHSCYYLTHKKLANRFTIVRPANIEHVYYQALGKASPLSLHKIFMYLEAWRFKRYEPVLASANLVLAISSQDEACLKQAFPGKRVEFVPAFHANDRLTVQEGRSGFVLYHGKLSVIENEQSALFLIREVFSRLKYPCVIAGMDPSDRLRKAASAYPNITVEANPPASRMEELISEAQVHLLVTFQATGLKLKLLNGLFSGRHIIVNHLMLAGSGLDALCQVAGTPEEMIRLCNERMEQPFTAAMIREREKALIPAYTNAYQARRIDEMIDYGTHA